MQNKICMRFMVKGRVQGVLFRASTQDEANKIQGVTGWVRNTSDGGVEVFACGEKEKLMQLHAWLETGPELARVDQVEFEERPWQEFDRFAVK